MSAFDFLWWSLSAFGWSVVALTMIAIVVWVRSYALEVKKMARSFDTDCAEAIALTRPRI